MFSHGELIFLGAGFNTISNLPLANAIFVAPTDINANQSNSSSTSKTNTSNDISVNIQVPIPNLISASAKNSNANETNAAQGSGNQNNNTLTNQSNMVTRTTINNRKIVSTTGVYYSLSELQTTFDSKLNFDNPRAQIKFDIKDIKSDSIYEIYYVLDLHCFEIIESITPPYTFNPSLQNLLQAATDADSLNNFHKCYGDSYVNSITLGRKASIIIQIECDSKEQQKSLSFNLSQNIGSISTGTSFTIALTKQLQNLTCKIHYRTAGLDYAVSGMVSSLDQLNTLIKEFTVDGQKSAPIPICWTTRPYKIALCELSPAAVTLPENKETTTANSVNLIQKNATLLENYCASARELTHIIQDSAKAIQIYLCVLNSDKIDVSFQKKEIHRIKRSDVNNFSTRNTFNILHVSKLVSQLNQLIDFVSELNNMDIRLDELDFKITQNIFNDSEIAHISAVLTLIIEELKAIIYRIPSELILPAVTIPYELIRKETHKKGEYHFSFKIPDGAEYIKIIITNPEGDLMQLPIEHLKLKQEKSRSILGLGHSNEIGVLRANQMSMDQIPIRDRLDSLYLKPSGYSDETPYNVVILIGFRAHSVPKNLIPNSNAISKIMDKYALKTQYLKSLSLLAQDEIEVSLSRILYAIKNHSRDAINFIDPAAISIYSIFDENAKNRSQAAFEIATVINNIAISKSTFANKPIVLVFNTKKRGENHWTACVILPKNYQTLKNQNEQIFFVDSLDLTKMLPIEFCRALTQQTEFTYSASTDELKTPQDTRHISATFPTAEFVKPPGELKKQQDNESDSDLWTVDNILKIIATGSMKALLQSNNTEDLRKLYPELANATEQNRQPKIPTTTPALTVISPSVAHLATSQFAHVKKPSASLEILAQDPTLNVGNKSSLSSQ